MDAITLAISDLTDRVIAYRIFRRMRNMDRLKEKLLQARGVVQRSVARIETKADALIAREDTIATQTDQAFAGHDAMLDDAGKGLDELSRALALVSNDPLQSSSGSPEVGQEATFPAGRDDPRKTM